MAEVGQRCRMALRSVALVVAFAVTLTAACEPVGISRDRAIELARSNAEGNPTVVAAEAGTLGEFVSERTLPHEPRGRRVWAVMFEGTFEGECVVNAKGELVCPQGARRKLIILDFATGDFIASESR